MFFTPAVKLVEAQKRECSKGHLPRPQQQLGMGPTWATATKLKEGQRARVVSFHWQWGLSGAIPFPCVGGGCPWSWSHPTKPQQGLHAFARARHELLFRP